MISSPLFRALDKLTVSRYMPDYCRILTSPECDGLVERTHRARAGEHHMVAYVRSMDGNDGACYYLLNCVAGFYTDEMSVEGQRMFQFLLPKSETEFMYDTYVATPLF